MIDAGHHELSIGKISVTSTNDRFSIAARVKFRPDDFMLSPFCASATDTPRGSCFSSKLAPGHLMMGGVVEGFGAVHELRPARCELDHPTHAAPARVE